MNPKEVLGSNTMIGKNYCDKLFAIEVQLTERPFVTLHLKSQKLARPILSEFFVWLKTHRLTAAGNAFGKAVNYTLDQWIYLE